MEKQKVAQDMSKVKAMSFTCQNLETFKMSSFREVFSLNPRDECQESSSGYQIPAGTTTRNCYVPGHET